ncbi:hypothetical protein ER308_21075 [Egibacter rhizosphaerae]|uniref:Ppx/GppA phosphatase N-terminal domain-containing protein n=1 Tax=Egibacter rhizosphaerae TaxID=1670831 RepID=A0A411YKU2_9ACTN|nr:hypothetical protein [Egibacter rhizosphaerae]QBI21801.1 hypothetical protein ER308_21075 [Egibacter rhizosphaerae]
MSETARLAAIDLGSNSAHLLVADVRSTGNDPAGHIRRAATRKCRLRLAEPVVTSGEFGAAVRGRVLDAVADLRDHARQRGAAAVALVATDALRHAADGAELQRELQAEVGLAARVLDGYEEAALAVRGIAAALDAPGGLLGLDLGGGSLELGLAVDGRPTTAATLPLGAARLTTRFTHDPPWLAERATLHGEALAALQESAGKLRAHPEWPVADPPAAGTAGTIRDLGRLGLALASGVEAQRVRGLVVTRAQLEMGVARVVAVPTADRLDLPGVSGSRADLLPAGGLVLLAAMEAFGLEQIQLCDWGLREGVVVDALTEEHVVRRADFVPL